MRHSPAAGSSRAVPPGGRAGTTRQARVSAAAAHYRSSSAAGSAPRLSPSSRSLMASTAPPPLSAPAGQTARVAARLTPPPSPSYRRCAAPRPGPTLPRPRRPPGPRPRCIIGPAAGLPRPIGCLACQSSRAADAHLPPPACSDWSQSPRRRSSPEKRLLDRSGPPSVSARRLAEALPKAAGGRGARAVRVGAWLRRRPRDSPPPQGRGAAGREGPGQGRKEPGREQ